MKVLFRTEVKRAPDLSIVLLDWSVRESYHSLDYLARQTAARERYELIWIEYYDTQPRILRERLRTAVRPPIDQWIVLDMPRDSYYHKHLMYNVGIAAARGRVINICDSDAMFTPTYVESILGSFARDPDIVLHMDEIRSRSRKFYPFNHPGLDEVLDSDCVNVVDGKPAGIVGPERTPVEDRLHVANYGASMSARRADLIAIGGADEHEDYLGHVCGPYDMTFRLVNYGRREVWHRSQWLYHTWHPGQSGAQNYLGPHDGRDMSATALRARRTGRVLPLRENPAIRALREAQLRPALWSELLELAAAPNVADAWSRERLCLRSGPVLRMPRALMRHPIAALALGRGALADGLEYARLVMRVENGAPDDGSAPETPARSRLLAKLAHMLKRSSLIRPIATGVLADDRRIAARALHRLEGLRTEGLREIVLFGGPTLCRVLRAFARDFAIRVVATLDESGVNEKQRAILQRGTRVVIASRYGIRWRRQWLVEQGLDTGQIQALEDSWEDEEAALLPRGGAVPGVELSLVLPTRGRPDVARRALSELASKAAAPECIEVLLYVDEDDPQSHDIDHPDLKVRRIVGPPGVGMGTITNECLLASRGRFAMLVNDDIRVRTKAWDQRIIEAAASVADGVVLVYPNDGHQRGRLSTFPVVPRAVLEELGSLASNRINHFHIESHVFGIFEELARRGHERRLYLDDVQIEHVTPGGARPVRAQVRGFRDDRVTYATQREERRRLARRLARRIGSTPPPPDGWLASVPLAPGGGEFIRGTPELSVCWLGSGDADTVAVQIADPRVDFELFTAGGPTPDRNACSPERLAPTSECIVFLGPGIEARPGWGAAVLAALRGNERIGALTGALLLARNGRLLRAGLRVQQRGDLASLVDYLRGLPFEDPRVAEPASVDGASLLGMVVRASVFRELDGLGTTVDTPLGLGLELGLRLRQKGLEIGYSPQLVWKLGADEDPADTVELGRVLARHPIDGLSARPLDPVAALPDGLEQRE
jgi:hypothetical protein